MSGLRLPSVSGYTNYSLEQSLRHYNILSFLLNLFVCNKICILFVFLMANADRRAVRFTLAEKGRRRDEEEEGPLAQTMGSEEC